MRFQYRVTVSRRCSLHKEWKTIRALVSKDAVLDQNEIEMRILIEAFEHFKAVLTLLGKL